MWDVFISHASEDKEDIARPLAEKLRKLGLEVWYDEYSLTLGDSLRKSIDEGLSKSDFGIIILSNNFFSKEWPQKELDGLFALEDGSKKVIIPLWHGINKSDVAKYSPMLAGRVAAKTNEGLDEIIKKILKAINPEAEYFISEDSVVKVLPSRINLNANEWAIRTSFTVHNMSNHSLHNVAIDITFEGPDINRDDVEFELVERTNIAKSNMGSLEIDTEFLGLDTADDEGNEHREYRLFHLGPQEHKTVLVKAKKPFKNPNFINISIPLFDLEPGKIFYL